MCCIGRCSRMSLCYVGSANAAGEKSSRLRAALLMRAQTVCKRIITPNRRPLIRTSNAPPVPRPVSLPQLQPHPWAQINEDLACWDQGCAVPIALLHVPRVKHVPLPVIFREGGDMRGVRGGQSLPCVFRCHGMNPNAPTPNCFKK